MKGTVRWFSPVRKYGFITGLDDKDVFVHLNQVEDNIPLEQGWEVEYEVVSTDKGFSAENVKIISKE